MVNPEFQRNVWLEINGQRLVLGPVVLVLCATTFAALDDLDWRKYVALLSMVLYCGIVLVWGSRQAFDALAEEARGQTWDTQRMSAQLPSAMLLGKLFGSTIYTWYLGSCCLLGLLVAFATRNPGVFAGWQLVSLILVLLLSGLLIQAVGLLMGSLEIRAGTARKSFSSLVVTFAALLMAIFLGTQLLREGSGQLVWYGTSWPVPFFLPVSLAVFLGWVAVGTHRLMCELLQVRVWPWVGVSFTLFLTLYVSGFLVHAWPESLISLYSLVGVVVAVLAAYAVAWQERRDWLSVRRLIEVWRGKNYRSLLELTPEWVPIVLYALTCALVASSVDLRFPLSEYEMPELFRGLLNIPLMTVLLMLRDIAILYYFSLGPNPDRADFSTLVTLVLLYGILPMLLVPMNLGFVVMPLVFEGDFLPGWSRLMVALAHLALVSWLLQKRMENRCG